MKHPLAVGSAVTLLVIAYAAPAIAAPDPRAGSWTPYPVAGLDVDQPKIDSDSSGTPTVASISGRSIMVSTYRSGSWGCPIELPGSIGESGYPPAMDVAADGTVAVAGSNYAPSPTAAAPQDVWVSIRRPGEVNFSGAGTGTGHVPDANPAIATSGNRTIAIWTSDAGTKLMGAEFSTAGSTTPRVLAEGIDMAFAKIRMDDNGNAVMVYRSSSSDRLQQNWLLWPAGSAPQNAQRLDVPDPDDFVESGAFQVSGNGRMILAAYDGRSGTDLPGAIRVFVGTTTTGFTQHSVISPTDPFNPSGILTGISSDGAHGALAFNWTQSGDAQSQSWLYSIDAQTGAAKSYGKLAQPMETGVTFSKILLDGANIYAAWTDSNRNALGGGIVKLEGSTVVPLTSIKTSDWIGMFNGPTGPAAYWPKQEFPDTWKGTLVTTLPHKPLKAKPTMTKITISRAGVVTVAGKVTPAAGATGCAGSTVTLTIRDTDYGFESAIMSAPVGKDGSFSATRTLARFTGCKKAIVKAELSTSDSIRPASTERTAPCSRR